VDALIVEDEGPVRTLVLDRPDTANALSVELVEALHAALDQAAGIRVLVLRGAGRHFCGGFDLGALPDETDATLLHRFVRIGLLLERLAAAPFTTVAVVHGSAVGAGADLVAACDHRLGAPDCSLRFPGSAFGVVLGTARLAGLVGSARATRLVTGGGRIRAAEAEAAGLLTAVGTPEELDDVVAAIAADAARPPAETLPALLAATRPAPDPEALAALVRSVARPGLRERIAAYAAR
jgi:enoyl-CoA hydratase